MSDYNITMRNLLEIRFKERQFSFLDFSGRLIDFLVKQYRGVKIRYVNNGLRVEVATAGLKEILFFSVENFGFQIEAISDFSEFRSEVEKIFKIISEFPDYRLGEIVRIGTKSFIYCHKKGQGFEAIKTRYKNKMLKSLSQFERKSFMKIDDLAYTFDLTIDDVKANIAIGPVNDNEALAKFFEGNQAYSGTVSKPGIMYIIDCYKTDLGKTLNNDQIKDVVLKNIDKIEENFNGFRDFIFDGSETDSNAE